MGNCVICGLERKKCSLTHRMKILGFQKEYYCSNCNCSECLHKKRIIQAIQS
jgi:hypothetical protein